MIVETITKKGIEKGIDIERILINQKWEVAKKIESWRKRNKKYFKNWNSVKSIHFLREKNGRS